MQLHRRSGWRSPSIVIVLATCVLGVLVLAAVLLARDGASRPGSEVTPLRVGYVPYWDQERGFDVVRSNPMLFDEVSPVWYSLDPDGSVVLADPDNTVVDLDTVRDLQGAGIRVLPTVTNLIEGEWNRAAVQDMLHDDVAMRRHVDALVALAVEFGYDGIDIDYEDLRAADRDRFTRFLERLGSALHEQNKILTVAVHPKTSDEGYDERNVAQDFQAIGEAVDQVRVMTYDYSWSDSEPGPVAPAEWVEDVIAWTVTQIPAEKVILGVVLLGYDWSQGFGETVDFGQARSRADRHGAEVRRAADGTPSFRYDDQAGITHEVWYEDAVSTREKLALVEQYSLGGVFFWRLGGEDPEVWDAVRATLGLPRTG